jgi:hypothetical protein
MPEQVLRRLHECLKKANAYWSYNRKADTTSRPKYSFPLLQVSESESVFLDFANMDFNALVYTPLTAEHQAQINNAFTWIHPLEFFDSQMVDFYLGSNNSGKRCFGPSVFNIEPFNPPKLPDAATGFTTLHDIAVSWSRHVHAQHTLFLHWSGNMRLKCAQPGQFLALSTQPVQHGDGVHVAKYGISCLLDQTEKVLGSTEHKDMIPKRAEIAVCIGCDNLHKIVKDKITCANPGWANFHVKASEGILSCRRYNTAVFGAPDAGLVHRCNDSLPNESVTRICNQCQLNHTKIKSINMIKKEIIGSQKKVR